MTTIERPALIIDAYSLFTRSFQANPSMSTHGEHIGGLTGFLKTLALLCDRVRPSEVIVVWEGGGSSRRRYIFKGYKQKKRPVKLNRFYGDELPATESNRNNQVIMIINALKKTAVKQLYVADCEADDVIGYLARHRYKEKRCVIASSDKDFHQLLSKNIIQWTFGKKKFVTAKTLIEQYGVSAENFCTVRSFIGDPSDNLKGVRGAGFKSLVKRFPHLSGNKFVSVDDLIEDAKYASETKKLKLYDNIAADAKLARRNWKLMYLDMLALSATQISKINYSFEESSYNNDKMGFLRILSRAGIQNFNANTFFASIQAHTK